MLRCMPLDDPPPNRFASDTAGATANAEATTMAAAKNRFFIANAFVEKDPSRNDMRATDPYTSYPRTPSGLALELWQRPKFRSSPRE
jgi:hypothetical protein